MPTPKIIIDNVTLNDTFLVSDIRRQFPSARADMQSVPGRDGSLVFGQTLEPREVSFRLWYPTSDHGAMLDAFSSLVELLCGGKRTLRISDEGGRTRTVWLNGDLDFDEYEETGSVEITLTQPDPYCALTPYDVTVERGQTTAVTLAHANPWLTIHAPAAVRSASNDLWGIVVNEEYPIYVKLPSAAAANVLIEYKGVLRHVEVNGSAANITLDSDWPDKIPAGRCTFRMISSAPETSAATVTITERCL